MQNEEIETEIKLSGERGKSSWVPDPDIFNLPKLNPGCDYPQALAWLYDTQDLRCPVHENQRVSESE
tara:strand:- start:19774 stop:19974 length:201 start_codon:yes stop_codon:yes gene_type:complete